MSEDSRPTRPAKQHLAHSSERVSAVEQSEIATDEDDGRDGYRRSFLIFNAMPSWLASFLVNITFILILALYAMTTEPENTISLEAGEIDSASIDDVNINLEDLEMDNSDPLESNLSDAPTREFTPETEQLTIDTELTSDDSNMLIGETTSFEGEQFTELTQSDLTNEISGRSENSRNQLLRKFGGNAATETAVELALQWIADHQLPDGGWNLDHTIGPKVNDRPRTSPNPGEYTDARMGATGLALLPFLGNGQTHRNGKHKDVVFNGLNFLMENAVRRGKGISYWDTDGEMYSHGLAAIVLNECYAMTGDENLRDFAQGTLYLIEDFQDPVGGGWRYERRKKGDTSMVGWQLMALKSGKLAGLNVNQKPFKLARKFLDSVSTDYGAYYGYQLKPIKTENGKFDRRYRARTAVGLLSQMYLGRDREHQGMVTGVGWMADEGPDIDADEVVNMYYNYYATQVMKHYGGEKWRTWNIAMRDFLVATQDKDGPARGSWLFNPNGQFQAAGGRLYVTSLCCMTLEVYYRYLPLYTEDATEDDFTTD